MAILVSITASAAAGRGIIPARPNLSRGTVAGTTVTFNIDNYDESLVYTITSTVGTVSRSGSVITISGVPEDTIITTMTRLPKGLSNSTTRDAEKRAYNYYVGQTGSYQYGVQCFGGHNYWWNGSSWNVGSAPNYPCQQTGYNYGPIKDAIPTGGGTWTDSGTEWWRIGT